MQLSELLLNRHLYRDSEQDSSTKDSVFQSVNTNPEEPAPLYSGEAAQDINISNVEINGQAIEPGTLQAALDVSNWGWTQSAAFASDDNDTVSWGSGIFTSANGNAYSISSGNTGNMGAKTYIYLDLLVSETTYQTTTTSADSVGLGKVLIGVAENGSAGATYNLTEASQVVADNILANTINTAQLKATAIDGMTITGALIRTSASGQRVELSLDELRSYDTGGVLRTIVENSGISFYGAGAALAGSIFGVNNDEINFYAGTQLYALDEIGFYAIGFGGGVGSLGTSGDPWAIGYIEEIYTDELDVIDGITLDSVRITSWTDISGFSGDLSDLSIDANKNWGGYDITNLGDVTMDNLRLASGGNIYYNSVIAFDFSTGTNEIIVGSGSLTDFIPYTNLGINLGTSSDRFNDLHVAGGDFYGPLDMNDNNIENVDEIEFGGSGQFIDSGANDMGYNSADNHEFYVGGTLEAIIDENIFTEGDLLANGSKPFLIPHPDGSDRLLRYTAQESPEVILRHRGKGKTGSDNKITITLPDHFTLVTDKKGDVTVNLTVIGDNRIFLQEEPTNSEIKIESSSPSVSFHYEVMAIRAGFMNRPVELDDTDSKISAKDKILVLKMKKRAEKTVLSKEKLTERAANKKKIVADKLKEVKKQAEKGPRDIKKIAKVKN